MWVEFWDMSSGGGHKTPYHFIYIEANSEGEAIRIFVDKFDQHPYEVACDCCGENFAVNEYDSLEEATRFHREDRYTGKPIQPLEEFIARQDICVIRGEDNG